VEEAVQGRATARGGRDDLRWRRAQRCAASGCVELAALSDGVAVRDSKDPGGPVLRYDREEFAVFVAAAKAGEFDDLCTG